MNSNFSVNHPLLFILAGLAVIAVVAQSAVFLKKALNRAYELGFEKAKVKKLITSAIIFTIAPAIAIGIGIITLYGSLGLPLPWLRLSVVGAIVYELSAADAACTSLGTSLGSALTAQQFTTIAWTMTIGITTGLVLVPLFAEKTLDGVASIGKKDKKWGELFTTSIFIGLIATFVGVGLSGITVDPEGRVSALVLIVSCIVMGICGILRNKLGWKWMNDYALPICMVIAMASAIPLTAWLD